MPIVYKVDPPHVCALPFFTERYGTGTIFRCDKCKMLFVMETLDKYGSRAWVKQYTTDLEKLDHAYSKSL